MDLEDIEQSITGGEITGADLVAALVLIAVGMLFYVVVGRLLRRAMVRLDTDAVPNEIAQLGVRIAQILVLAVFVGWALSVLGAEMGWLTALLLLVLILGSWIAKPYLDALSSSAVVATRSAFTVGDEIGVDGVVGEIEAVANRSTVVRTRDGRRIHVPNSELLDKTVTVYTAYEERRSSINVTLDLATNLDEADQTIRQTLTSLDSIDRVGSIRAQSLGDGVELSIRFWHGPRVVDANDAVDAAVRALKTAFEETGIKYAPTTSVTIDSWKPNPG